MNATELLELGFSISAGQIDYKNVNYGRLLATDVLLTPEGEDLVLALRAANKPVAPEDAGEPNPPPVRRGRPPKAQE